jgi:hypothetical protein
MTRAEAAFGIPDVVGWDSYDDAAILDINSDHYNGSHGEGCVARCHECLNQPRQDGDVRCVVCAFKHARRVRGARRALDDAGF